MRFAVDVAGAVICGPVGLEQLLFETPARRWRHGNGVLVDALPQQLAHLLAARELFEDGGLIRFEDEAVCRVG